MGHSKTSGKLETKKSENKLLSFPDISDCKSNLLSRKSIIVVSRNQLSKLLEL